MSDDEEDAKVEKDSNVMTGAEIEYIRKCFQKDTKDKINDLYQLRNLVACPELEELSELLWQMEKMKLTMDDFIQFSESRHISIDKVLVAQDCTDDMLADAVIKAKEQAKKRIIVKEELE
jgi:hypothetical protein